MRILIDVLSANDGGGLTYLINVFEQLKQQDKQNKYFVLITDDLIPKLSLDTEFYSLIVRKRTNFVLRFIWEQLSLIWILRKLAIDLLFIPANVDVFLKSCPSVVVMRNIEPLLSCEAKGWGPKIRWFFLNFFTRISFYSATKVIAVSDFAKHLAITRISAPASKIAVIHHGRNTAFVPKPELDKTRALGFLRQYNLQENNYLIAVSSIRRHKNFLNLVKAFELLKSDTSLKLVVAGRPIELDYYEELQDYIKNRKLADKVYLIGEVAYDQLPFLYAFAKAAVMPSLFESFGHPLVEAMSSGVPLAASNLEIVKEICGKAVLIFDPRDIFSFSTVLTKLIELPKDSQLVQLGLARANQLSWKTNIKTLLELFNGLIKKGDLID